MALLPDTPDLVTIRTPGGAAFRVARPYQDQFQGLVNQLEAGGYTIDPAHSGGYNRRYIAGTQTPSQHAFGTAIDVNWDQNPHGSAGGTLPADVARAVAKQYGMTWGGDWQGGSRDPMHFEIARARANAAPPAAATPAAAYAASPDAQYKTGLPNFGVAAANMPDQGGADYGGGQDAPVAPQPQVSDRQRLLALAMSQGGMAGMLGGAPIGDAFQPAAQPAQPDAQGQPLYMPGAPIPLSRRLG